MAAHQELAVGLTNTLERQYGPTIVDVTAAEIADEVVAHLTRVGTRPLFARVLLEQIAEGTP